jgi:hypothetical protein
MRAVDAGDRVRFQARDVFLPGGGVMPAPGETELEGTVLDFSDSGEKARYFAVVEVVTTQSLIVPVQKLEAVETSPPKSNS